jgi:hypothetical protein
MTLATTRNVFFTVMATYHGRGRPRCNAEILIEHLNQVANPQDHPPSLRAGGDVVDKHDRCRRCGPGGDDGIPVGSE